MDARTIRLSNLRLLIDEVGGIDRLADLAGSSRKTLDQILAGTPLPSGHPRSIGPNLARRIESAAGKPHGWLDVPHDEALAPAVAELIDFIRSASQSGRLTAEQARAIYTVARAMDS